MTAQEIIQDAVELVRGMSPAMREKLCPTYADTLQYVRTLVECELEEIRDSKSSTAYVVPSYEDHLSALNSAARATGAQGATEAQVKRLAREMADNHDPLHIGLLSKGEASNMISN